MRISSWMMGTVVLVQLADRFTIGSGLFDFREEIGRQIADQVTGIVIDLNHVKRVDSSGLGELVASHKSASEQGIAVKLCRATKNLLEILQRTKLDQVFEIYDTAEDAVASFKGQSSTLPPSAS